MIKKADMVNYIYNKYINNNKTINKSCLDNLSKHDLESIVYENEMIRNDFLCYIKKEEFQNNIINILKDRESMSINRFKKYIDNIDYETIDDLLLLDTIQVFNNPSFASYGLVVLEYLVNQKNNRDIIIN